MHNESKLFGKTGYISIKEYSENITSMRKNGSWKLPLGIGDRAHLFFLKVAIKFSWFADILSIAHASDISPSYSMLFSYLQKKRLVDSFRKRNLHLHGYFSYSLEKRIFLDGKLWSIQGHGIAKDKATAFSKALGEMIERLISGVYDSNDQTMTASPDELGKEFPMLYPPEYHRFLDIQKKKFHELGGSPNHPIEWVRGMNLITKKTTYIPKTMTSWFTGSFKNEHIFIEATTSGCAGYFTRTGAVLRGLLEAVERDAFLVHWLTQIPPQVIRKETLPDGIREEMREFESIGISLSILDTTSIAIPSISIIAINALSETPQVVLSTATALTSEEAIRNGLREMAIASEMFHYTGNEKQSQKSIDPEAFISQFDKISRQLYWRGSERIKQFQWFLSGKEVSYDEICGQDIASGADDASRLKSCLRILQDRGSGYHPIAYFPKHPVQKEIGFFVAQVYIPKAFPLYLLEYQGTFDSDRLREFALSKGVTEWTLNPLPHMLQ